MDITSILQMHQELSLTAVFLLMFVLDLFASRASSPLVTPIGLRPVGN